MWSVVKINLKKDQLIFAFVEHNKEQCVCSFPYHLGVGYKRNLTPSLRSVSPSGGHKELLQLKQCTA